MLAIVDMMSIVEDHTEKLTITTLVVSTYFYNFLVLGIRIVYNCPKLS